MARSPLTLAASVTAALPRTAVVNVGELSEGTGGRFDSALVTTDDGRRLVVRAATDEASAAELETHVRTLSALSAGVRALLPFTAPEILGRSVIGGLPAVVETHVAGYRVDAGEVPRGRGVATALGAAVARIHDLPGSVVRDAGLPVRTAEQVRADAERTLDRAESTGRLPFALLRRWSTALSTDELWRFETSVVLGGVDPASFVFEQSDEPVVVGLLDWQGLSIGDPAVDLRWTASAPAARDDVLHAYAAAGHRASDDHLAQRARLHAEFEFASWLVHGHTIGSESIMSDAVALLDALAEGVQDEAPYTRERVTADDAFAASGRIPTAADAVDTSMQTDAFDAETMSAFAEEDAAAEQETQPLDMREWDADERRAAAAAGVDGADADAPRTRAQARAAAGAADGRDAVGESTAQDDPTDAARNALRRWTGTA